MNVLTNHHPPTFQQGMVSQVERVSIDRKETLKADPFFAVYLVPPEVFYGNIYFSARFLDGQQPPYRKMVFMQSVKGRCYKIDFWMVHHIQQCVGLDVLVPIRVSCSDTICVNPAMNRSTIHALIIGKYVDLHLLKLSSDGGNRHVIHLKCQTRMLRI